MPSFTRLHALLAFILTLGLAAGGVGAAEAAPAQPYHFNGTWSFDGVIPKKGTVHATFTWGDPYADGSQVLTQDVNIIQDGGKVIFHKLYSSSALSDSVTLDLEVGHSYATGIDGDFTEIKNFAKNNPQATQDGSSYLDLFKSNVPDPVYVPGKILKLEFSTCRARYADGKTGDRFCAYWSYDAANAAENYNAPTGFALTLNYNGHVKKKMLTLGQSGSLAGQNSYTFTNIPNSRAVTLSVAAVNSAGQGVAKVSNAVNSLRPARVSGLEVDRYKSKWSDTKVRWAKAGTNGGTKIFGYEYQLQRQKLASKKWVAGDGAEKAVVDGSMDYSAKPLANFFTGFGGACFTRTVKIRVRALNTTQTKYEDEGISGPWSKWKTFTFHDPMYDGPGSSATFYPNVPKYTKC